VVFAIYSTVSPDPNPFSPGWSLGSISWKAVADFPLQAIVHTFLPVRSFSDPEYWSHTDTFWRDHQALALPGGILIAVLLAIALLPRWTNALAFVVTVAVMSAFQIARYPGSMRHWGHQFMLLIALAWLGRLVAPMRRHLLSSVLLVVIGAFQLESAAAAVWRDHNDVFAAGEATADFIRKAGLQDLPIVAGPRTSFCRSPAISAGRSSAPSRRRYRRPWSSTTAGASSPRARCSPSPPPRPGAGRAPCFVISNRPLALPSEVPTGTSLTYLYNYAGVLCMTNERFYVYELRLS